MWKRDLGTGPLAEMPDRLGAVYDEAHKSVYGETEVDGLHHGFGISQNVAYQATKTEFKRSKNGRFADPPRLYTFKWPSLDDQYYESLPFEATATESAASMDVNPNNPNYWAARTVDKGWITYHSVTTAMGVAHGQSEAPRDWSGNVLKNYDYYVSYKYTQLSELYFYSNLDFSRGRIIIRSYIYFFHGKMTFLFKSLFIQRLIFRQSGYLICSAGGRVDGFMIKMV